MLLGSLVGQRLVASPRCAALLRDGQPCRRTPSRDRGSASITPSCSRVSTPRRCGTDGRRNVTRRRSRFCALSRIRYSNGTTPVVGAVVSADPATVTPSLAAAAAENVEQLKSSCQVLRTRRAFGFKVLASRDRAVVEDDHFRTPPRICELVGRSNRVVTSNSRWVGLSASAIARNSSCVTASSSFGRSSRSRSSLFQVRYAMISELSQKWERHVRCLAHQRAAAAASLCTRRGGVSGPNRRLPPTRRCDRRGPACPPGR